MTAIADRKLTLAETLWPVSGAAGRAIQNVLLAIVGSALLTLSAKIQVPIWPVPMTMQTFVVLVLGMAYGWKLGGATVLLYLAEGAIGLPVFAAGGGLPYMVGPTGGYLAGFVLAAALCGWLAERGWDRSALRTAVAMVAGHVVIIALGWAWLSQVLGDALKAYVNGVVPFYWATLYKTALAVAAMPGAWWLLKRFR